MPKAAVITNARQVELHLQSGSVFIHLVNTSQIYLNAQVAIFVGCVVTNQPIDPCYDQRLGDLLSCSGIVVNVSSV